MSTDAELLAPVTSEQAPPPEPEPQAAAPVSEDADLDKIIEEQAIDIPGDTDKLVPLAAVENARAKLKTVRAELEAAKAGTAKATELETKVAQLEQQLNQALPYAQAYQAALQAQQPADTTPKGPTPEQTAALEEIAKDYDFYKTDGTYDLDRAARHQARIRKEAEAIAQQTVAPLQKHNAESAAAAMLRNAKLTTLQDGSKPSPEVLDYVWGQLDHSVTGTKAGAQQAFAVAVGYAQMLGKMVKGTTAAAPSEPLPPPLLTEKSGGREHTGPTLTEADKRAARDLNMTDKEYAEELGKMPQGWGRSAR